jgi:hypothetical protein
MIDDFEEKNLKPFYDTSVRYWTKNYSLLVSAKGKTDVTGWSCDRGFGVCGIHPALTYEFINNFHRIEDIYNASIRNDTGKPYLLDDLVMTPLEKIREMVYGSPTELTTSDAKYPLGSNCNYFRPRLFLLRPKKFRVTKESPDKATDNPSDEREYDLYSLGQLSLHENQGGVAYDLIEKLTKDGEFMVYPSPVGDIFIEPIMYDFHPTKFIPKIESRNPVVQTQPIYFRTFINTNTSQRLVYRKDTAYFFNNKANHPLFITEKDTVRVTEALKPELLRTSVVVQGSVSGYGGMTDQILSQLYNTTVPWLVMSQNQEDASQGVSTAQKTVSFQQGVYVANGFPNFLLQGIDEARKVQSGYLLTREYDGTYNKQLLDYLIVKKEKQTVLSLLKGATKSIKGLTNKKDYVFYHPQLQATYTLLKQDVNKMGQGDKDSYIIQGVSKLEGSSQLEDFITLKLIAPTLWDFCNYLAKKQLATTTKANSRASTETGDDTTADKPKNFEVLISKGIKNTDALFNAKVNIFTDTFKNQTIGQGAVQGAQPSSFVEIQANIEKSSGAITADIVQELKLFSEATILDPNQNATDTTVIKEQHETLAKLDQERTYPAVITRGYFKLLERQGYYNPKTDFVSKYGYNPGPTIYSPYMNSGAEATTFAKIVFNRLTSRAYEINVDIIGRPELWLNRPYYIENKQSIGLLFGYTISYGIEKPFASTVRFSYVRRNAITYSYTLDELDDVAPVKLKDENKARPNSTKQNKQPDSGTNAFFNQKALDYYQGVKEQAQNAKRSQTANEFFSAGGPSGGWAGIGVGIVGQTLNDVVSSKMKESYPKGGLFVAHDHIGHMDYNMTKTQNDGDILQPEKMTKELKGDPRFEYYLGDDKLTADEARTIYDALEAVYKSFTELASRENALILNNTALERNKKNLENIQKAIDDTKDKLDKAEKDPELSELSEQLAKLLDQQKDVTTLNNELIAQNKVSKSTYSSFTTAIYGKPATFEPTKRAVEGRTPPGKYDAGYAKTSFVSQNEKWLLQMLYESIPTKSSIDGVNIKNKWTIEDDKDRKTSGKSYQLTIESLKKPPMFLAPKGNTSKS